MATKTTSKPTKTQGRKAASRRVKPVAAEPVKTRPPIPWGLYKIIQDRVILPTRDSSGVIIMPSEDAANPPDKCHHCGGYGTRGSGNFVVGRGLRAYICDKCRDTAVPNAFRKATIDHEATLFEKGEAIPDDEPSAAAATE